MPIYPARPCDACGNMLPACDEPSPTHLCVRRGNTADRYHITPPILATLDNGGRDPSPCLVWAIVPDPVNRTTALVSAPDAPGWEVKVHADRITF